MSENQNDSTQKAQLAYLALLADMADPDQYLEVRWRPLTARMRRRFISVGRLGDAALLMRCLRQRTTSTSVSRCATDPVTAGRAAIGALHLAYIESDHAATAERLAAFAHPPTMVIASGHPPPPGVLAAGPASSARRG